MLLGCFKFIDVFSLKVIDVSFFFKKINFILKFFKFGEKKNYLEGKEIFFELILIKFNYLKENMFYFCLSRV